MSVSARGILASDGAMARHVRPIGGTQIARSEFEAKARSEKGTVGKGYCGGGVEAERVCGGG
jgi:hypothetical protein